VGILYVHLQWAYFMYMYSGHTLCTCTVGILYVHVQWAYFMYMYIFI
jgi:hypothetical protein